MRPLHPLVAIFIAVLPGRAMAHPGHLSDAGGHDHRIAAAALGIAITLGVGAWLRDRRRAKADRRARNRAARDTA